jgi:hypothetical protein
MRPEPAVASPTKRGSVRRALFVGRFAASGGAALAPAHPGDDAGRRLGHSCDRGRVEVEAFARAVRIQPADTDLGERRGAQSRQRPGVSAQIQVDLVARAVSRLTPGNGSALGVPPTPGRLRKHQSGAPQNRRSRRRFVEWNRITAENRAPVEAREITRHRTAKQGVGGQGFRLFRRWQNAEGGQGRKMSNLQVVFSPIGGRTRSTLAAQPPGAHPHE